MLLDSVIPIVFCGGSSGRLLYGVYEELQRPDLDSHHTEVLKSIRGIPKILLPVEGRPLILRRIDDLIESGFTKIILLTNHYSDKVEEAISKLGDYPDDIQIIIRDDNPNISPLFQMNHMLHLVAPTAKHVLISFGDTYSEAPFKGIAQEHLLSGRPCTFITDPSGNKWTGDIVISTDALSHIPKNKKLSERHFGDNTEPMKSFLSYVKDFGAPVKMDYTFWNVNFPNDYIRLLARMKGPHIRSNMDWADVSDRMNLDEFPVHLRQKKLIKVGI